MNRLIACMIGGAVHQTFGENATTAHITSTDLSQIYVAASWKRWSHFLRQPAKVDSTMQRTIHHEDAETVFGGVPHPRHCVRIGDVEKQRRPV